MVDNSEHQVRYQQMKKVTLVGAMVNFILAVVQVLIGVSGHSSALVADGVHTVSDLLGDFAVLWASKEANKSADEDHPYGHGRFETLATVVLGVILLVVGALIGMNAINKLIHVNDILQPQKLTIFAAMLAIVFKESLFHYTMRVAKATRSKMLEANAWHHRSDVFSSVIVLIGIVGALWGYVYMDVVAAFLVAILISKMGFGMAWESVKELADNALDPEKVETIKNMIADVEGVQSLHMLRTRKMGGYALADVHIQVEPRLSVSEGHQISETVRQTLIKSVTELDDITVHIDPEDDEFTVTCAGLPKRSVFMAQMAKALDGIVDKKDLAEVTLHYLNGKLDVDIHCTNPKVNVQQVVNAVKKIENVGKVYLCLTMRDNSA